MVMNRSVIDSRYRPALIALAGVSAAYAIYLLRLRYLASTQAPESQSQLRRRNAIRRRDGSRRRQTLSSAIEADSITVSEQAIAALQSRIEENRSYGYIDIHSIGQVLGQQSGRRCEILVPLLPGMLPTVEHFQAEEDGLSTEEARALRHHAETVFMDAFLVNQYSDFHTIGPLEVDYLQERLGNLGIEHSVIRECIEGFNTDATYGFEIRQASQAEDPSPPSGATDFQRMGGLMEALDDREIRTDEHSNFSWREGDVNTNSDREGQNTLNLLYNIAADQARKDGYIHRGVECNGCGTMPIQGIRYRCANCLDFDLCESCEAHEIHLKTHVFYKIRVPAPSLGALGNSRQGLPVWYPGKPTAMPRSLPRELSGRLLHESGFDNTELDALWDQFRCLAGTEWRKDPNKLGMAIDRKTFDRCFVPPLSIRPPPPNLIYDRMFAFYDTNKDGLIGFEEFVTGLAGLNDKSRDGRLRRIFQGYDIDGDGYVDRRDFLRIFRAFYTLSKELNREMVVGMEEDLIEDGARDVVQGTQPISSAFPGSSPPAHASLGGIGKEIDSNGDLVISDSRGILDDESHSVSDRNRFIADVAMRRQPPSRGSLYLRSQADLYGTHTEASRMEDSENFPETDPARPLNSMPASQYHDWPPSVEILAEDVSRALGGEVPLEEIMDPVDRSRVIFARRERVEREYHEIDRRRSDAVRERWARRKFYTDVEEGATAPPGYTEADSSDDDLGSGNEMDSVTSASMSKLVSSRSRSSSKVRFEDSVTDTDYETRSNASSRSIPVGERWGGYDISEVEKDAGKEILYQAVQQGFNELLDQLFKKKEDLAMQAHKSRKWRRHHVKDLVAFAKWSERKSANLDQGTGLNGDKLAAAAGDTSDGENKGKQVDFLSDQAEYSPQTTLPLPPSPDSPITREMDDKMAEPSLPHPTHAPTSHRDPTLPQFRPDEAGTQTTLPPSYLWDKTDHNNNQQQQQNHHRYDQQQDQQQGQQKSRSRQSSSPNPLTFGPPPYSPATVQILRALLRDEQTEQEASVRGGFGRLNYQEFVKGMCGQLDDDIDDDCDDDEEEEEEDEEEAGDGDGNGDERESEDDGIVGSAEEERDQGAQRRGSTGGGSGRIRMRRRRRRRRKRKMGERMKDWAGGGGMGKLGFVGSWIEMASF